MRNQIKKCPWSCLIKGFKTYGLFLNICCLLTSAEYMNMSPPTSTMPVQKMFRQDVIMWMKQYRCSILFMLENLGINLLIFLCRFSFFFNFFLFFNFFFFIIVFLLLVWNIIKLKKSPYDLCTNSYLNQYDSFTATKLGNSNIHQPRVTSKWYTICSRYVQYFFFNWKM